MRSNFLTIVLIINEISEYFDLTLASIENQTCQLFDIFVIDKNALTNFEDVEYVINENWAINNCKTELIYFMSEKDILRLDFVSTLHDMIYSKPSDVYWFFKIDNVYNVPFKGYLKKNPVTHKNFLITNSTEDKVFRVAYLKENYLAFDLTKYRYNINHIMLNYTVTYHTDIKYFIKKELVYHRTENLFLNNDYVNAYKQMLEDLKRNFFFSNRKCNSDLLECIKLEDANLRLYYKK